ncbi:hypothetical protein AVEN_38554-1 [Araneus ventricosus]|uniref:Uncharacterized protein n=1 Tax=Araneus ventricosus TaxID=182803 RepID=A0A4Y2TUD9_ARAVE|nr:hypothetical protein AVEN_38554-1 [Araneus ventricosus]
MQGGLTDSALLVAGVSLQVCHDKIISSKNQTCCKRTCYLGRDRRVPGSEPTFTEDPPSVWAWCTLILPSSVERPPAGVMQKLGERVELRCCNRHLTEVEIYEFYSIP